MQKITRLPYLAFILSVFVLASCGKDEDSADPVADPTNPSTQKCIVTNVKSFDGADNYETIFDYNGNRQLTKVSAKENGVLESYTEAFEYNSSGRISKITYMDGSSIDGYTTYTYNGDGLLTRRESYSSNSGSPIALQSFRTYEYDSNKKLTRYNRYEASAPTVVERYSLYTYPTANTATEMNYENQTGGSAPTLQSTVNYTFDDKKSPQQLLGVYWEDEFVSEHNPTRVEYISASGGTPDVSTYTYEYNAEGFPTKVNEFENGAADGTINLTYNCN